MSNVHWLGTKGRRARLAAQQQPRRRRVHPFVWLFLFTLALDALVVWAAVAICSALL